MRIAVISDVHANIEALQTVIEHIKEQRVDESIFLGDLVMNGPYPKEVLAMMNELAPIAWIKGNTDNWFDEIDDDFKPVNEREEYIYSLYQYAKERLSEDDIEILLSKPDKQLVEIEGVKILCVHGSHRSMSEPIGIMASQENIQQIINEIRADILFCGHTHCPYYVSFNGKRIINVGAVSLALDGEAKASYGILEIGQNCTSYTNFRLDYNIEKVIDSAKSNRFPYLDVYINKLKEAK